MREEMMPHLEKRDRRRDCEARPARPRDLARRGGAAALLAAVAAMLLAAPLTRPASAAPLIVGDTRCGTLHKSPTRGWVVKGCDPVRYFAELPPNCACGMYGKSATGAPECLCAPCPCNVFGRDTAGNVECLCTAAPARPACPQGELPPLNRPGFDGWVGRDNVRIGTGKTHTWCVTVDRDVSRLAMSVGDRTASAQCAWLRTTFAVPPGASWQRPPQPQTGRTSSWTFISPSGPLPRGVWTIAIENQSAPECFTKYQVVAHE